MSQEQTVERGDEVVCEVTGFQGIVTGHSLFLQGVDRYTVTPPLDKDGKPRDAYEIDVTNLKVVTKRKVQPHPQVKVNDLNLGDEVEDTVTGFKGIITCESLALNGCTRVLVQPKVDEKGKLRDGKGFDIGRLKAIKKEAVKEGQRSTGAPMERAGQW